MRFYLLTILCVLALGCQSDPNCRRETALLRSEILDLEDKYYLLKSERDSLLQNQGTAVNQIYAGEPQIYTAGEPIYEQPALIYEQPPLLDGQLLGSEVIYDQNYDQGIAYVDNQSHYVDTGEPYYGAPTYDNVHYHDPDIVYDDQIGYPNEMGYQDNYPNEIGYQDTIINPGEIINPSQPTLARSTNQLAPDDSILPLYSSQPNTSVLDTPPEDFDLHAPLLDQEIDSYQSDLSDEQADMNELNLLLEEPDKHEIGFGSGANLQEITEVVINRLATQGHDIDGLPGDEGLDLLIQPRSADGQVQLTTGQLTVSVIDPTQPAQRQRIGLWKFVESETELFFANNELGNYGILLHLPWDQQTPVNENLTVHVRFIPPSGQTFETTTQIQIEPPQSNYSPDDPLVTGWTRSDSRWDAGRSSARTPNRSGLTTSEWIRRRTAPTRAQVQSPVRIQAPAAARRRIQALPAKTTIQKPAWRPTR